MATRSEAIHAARKFASQAIAPVSRDISVVVSGEAYSVRLHRLSIGPVENEFGGFLASRFVVDENVESVADPRVMYVLTMSSELDEATVMPAWDANMPVVVRFDSGCISGQMHYNRSCDCREQLQQSMYLVAANGQGAIVQMPYHDGRGKGYDFHNGTLWLERLLGVDTIVADAVMSGHDHPELVADERTYHDAAATLKFLGLGSEHRLHVITNNPDKRSALLENGFMVDETRPAIVPLTIYTTANLKAKARYLGHEGLFGKESESVIVLLSGRNRVGKTTAFRRMLELANVEQFVISEEMQDDSGERVGFASVNASPDRTVFAHKTDIRSDAMHADYFVDTMAVENAFVAPIEKAIATDNVLVLDEIGHIQLASPAFRDALDRYMPNARYMFATVGENVDWSYENDDRIIRLELTEENRDVVPLILAAMIKRIPLLDRFPDGFHRELTGMVKRYLNQAHYESAYRLFGNAIVYVDGQQVTATDPASWNVSGNHGKYQVDLADHSYSCECDLFNGKGKFLQREECSHIQAVRLLAHC